MTVPTGIDEAGGGVNQHPQPTERRLALQAADAMGLTRAQRLRKLELPLATPAIMAGVRISVVSTVGMLTIAALVGLGGLGQLIMIGLNRPDINSHF